MSARLAGAYRPPRFTHGDCHAHQFFVVHEESGWRVTGVVDMEVSSAGDCVEDLMKFSIELAQSLEFYTRWWEALFAGYGGAPDFDAFRLRLLGAAPLEYGPSGKWVQTNNREAMVLRLLQAPDWPSLFAPIVSQGSGSG
jgi:aminoglycoside phosphotransferase (APT) family kinase protein